MAEELLRPTHIYVKMVQALLGKAVLSDDLPYVTGQILPVDGGRTVGGF